MTEDLREPTPYRRPGYPVATKPILPEDFSPTDRGPEIVAHLRAVLSKLSPRENAEAVARALFAEGMSGDDVEAFADLVRREAWVLQRTPQR